MKKEHRVIKAKNNSLLTTFLVDLDKPQTLLRQHDFEKVLKELLSNICRYQHYEYALHLISDIYPYKIGEFWNVIMLNYRDYVSRTVENMRNKNHL